MNKRNLSLCLMITSIMLGASGAQHIATAAAVGPQIWFAPGDDLDVSGVVAHPDFESLFASNSGWQAGETQTKVFQLRAPWFLRMPDSVVRTAASFLLTHNIEIASPMGGVPSDTCGRGVEGIMAPRQMSVYPREMLRKGLRLDYAVLDEPLFYGHDYSGHNACQLTVAEVASGVVSSIRMIRGYYPNIKVALVEPTQSLSGGPNELAEFLDDYKQSLGEYPALVRFDIKWDADWRSNLNGFIRVLKARKIGLGVIYDATRGGAAVDDAAWVASAKLNVLAFEQEARSIDAVSIQSWNAHPVSILPETESTTTSGFLKWYVTRKR